MSNGINGPEQDDLLVLVDEEGEEHRYSLERIVELDEKKYVVMIRRSRRAKRKRPMSSVWKPSKTVRKSWLMWKMRNWTGFRHIWIKRRKASKSGAHANASIA